jgi:transposase
MGGALPMHLRSLIVEQYSQGNTTLLAISQQHGLSYATVRTIWKRYKAQGSVGLIPHYNHCGPSKPKSEEVIYRCALWLKRHHPLWGAALIRTILRQRYVHLTLPSERTLQRWFKAEHLYQPKSVFPPPAAIKGTEQQPKVVHDVWQIDAKEKLHLSSGEKACYLTVVDQYSGCLLKAVVFPLSEHQ